MLITIDHRLRTRSWATAIRRINTSLMLVKNNSCVITVNETYRARDTFSKMNIPTVLIATRIVIRIRVKNVIEESAPIRKWVKRGWDNESSYFLSPRICRTRIDIGTRSASSVLCAKLHWLINHSAVRMNNCTAANATISNSPRVVINVTKSSNQVRRGSGLSSRGWQDVGFRNAKTRIPRATVPRALLHVYLVFTTHWNEKFHSKGTEKLLCSVLWRKIRNEMYELLEGKSLNSDDTLFLVVMNNC